MNILPFSFYKATKIYSSGHGTVSASKFLYIWGSSNKNQTLLEIKPCKNAYSELWLKGFRRQKLSIELGLVSFLMTPFWSFPTFPQGFSPWLSSRTRISKKWRDCRGQLSIDCEAKPLKWRACYIFNCIYKWLLPLQQIYGYCMFLHDIHLFAK